VRTEHLREDLTPLLEAPEQNKWHSSRRLFLARVPGLPIQPSRILEVLAGYSLEGMSVPCPVHASGSGEREWLVEWR
jgi:hypothetical protein